MQENAAVNKYVRATKECHLKTFARHFPNVLQSRKVRQS